VPRKTKNTQNQNQIAPESGLQAPGPKTGKKAPRRASEGAKKSTPIRKKTGETRKTKSRAISKSARADEPTDEQISIRAYFISERRHRLDLPGDASSDWLEAKRQLLSERGG
jgi:hypothetical protein